MMLIVILTLAAAVIAQAGKFLVPANYRRGLTIKKFNAYSGMPSSHAATVVALATIVGLVAGWASAEFGLALIFAILIVRDALGLRNQVGAEGKAINQLVKELQSKKLINKNYPTFEEHVGHTGAQVLVGSLIGVIISLLGFYLFHG